MESQEKIQQFKYQQLYYSRKFYEFSQEILELIEANRKISSDSAKIMKNIKQIANDISKLISATKINRNKEIINSIIAELKSGKEFTTPSIANEYGLTKRQASYIIDCIFKTETYLIRQKKNRILILKEEGD